MRGPWISRLSPSITEQHGKHGGRRWCGDRAGIGLADTAGLGPLHPLIRNTTRGAPVQWIRRPSYCGGTPCIEAAAGATAHAGKRKKGGGHAPAKTTHAQLPLNLSAVAPPGGTPLALLAPPQPESASQKNVSPGVHRLKGIDIPPPDPTHRKPSREMTPTRRTG